LITKISTPSLIASINHKGAELVSLRNTLNAEYIWEGNPAFWNKHSPVLFPIVGTLKDNQYRHNGETYSLSRHGFARDMEFELIEKSENRVVFSLVHSEETLQHYPFEFELQISYTLLDNCLRIGYKVINKNSFSMPFSIGAHPAFALPKSFDDYQILFEKQEELTAYQLENDLISERTIQLPLEKKKLPLTYSLFENDALIFKKIQSKSVDILEKNKPLLRIRFDNFPSLGIWTKNNAPFICIEPWLGYSDTSKNSGNLSEKEGIQILEKKEIFHCQFSIEIL
jgi:galactose mutarotase-like enzyme